MLPAWPICVEKRSFSLICQQRSKTSRTGTRATQIAGSAVEGSLDLDLFFDFVLLSGNDGVVFELVAPASNGNGLGVVEETIQDRTGSRHVAEKFAPFLQ